MPLVPYVVERSGRRIELSPRGIGPGFSRLDLFGAGAAEQGVDTAKLALLRFVHSPVFQHLAQPD